MGSRRIVHKTGQGPLSQTSNMILCRGSGLVLCLLLLFPFSASRIIPQGSERDMKSWIRVGSRPPHCERRCIGCGPCEPVQVPAVPMGRAGRLAFRVDDGGSNYKPVSWKCKCGDQILNP